MHRIIIAKTLLIFLITFAHHTVHAASIQLSKVEQEWLQDHKTIRMSGPQAFPPFQYVDSDGTFKGMASDYIFHIANMVGLQVKIAKNQPWSEILKNIEQKEIDILSCAGKTSGRENYLLFTKPHLSFPLVIISRNDGPFISGLQSLHKKRIAGTRKNATFAWLQRDNIIVEPHYVDSPLKGLREISLGRADASIDKSA